MRIVVGLSLLTSGVWAQAPGYLLNDLESAAARDIPYFAVEGRLRVAELTRFDRPEISRKFAEAAARTGLRPCGTACYTALLTLADFDFEAAESAAALNESGPAYAALTHQAVYNDDPELFLRLAHDAHQIGLHTRPAVTEALERWHDDPKFAASLLKLLIADFPSEPTPGSALVLLDAIKKADPANLDPDLIREAATVVRKAVTLPVFNQPDSWPIWTTFAVHGHKVTVYSLAESAYFAALAFSVAVEGLPEDKTLPVWTQHLAGLKIEEVAATITPVAVREDRPVPPATPLDPPPDSPEARLLNWLELAGHGDLTPEQFGQIHDAVCAELPNFQDEARIGYATRFYHASMKWPAVPERDLITALYIREVQLVAVSKSPFAERLRESGELLRRLDAVAARLGRVPSKWPDPLKENKSLLLRHLVYEAEQASLNMVIDATFPITGDSEMTLQNLRGRVVIIAFWRSDCRACEHLREAINGINTLIGKGRIWALAVSDQPEADVLAALDKSPFWASIALDQSAHLARSFGVRNLPTVVVIDRAGRIAARIEAHWSEKLNSFDFPISVLYDTVEAAKQ